MSNDAMILREFIIALEKLHKNLNPTESEIEEVVNLADNANQITTADKLYDLVADFDMYDTQYIIDVIGEIAKEYDVS